MGKRKINGSNDESIKPKKVFKANNQEKLNEAEDNREVKIHEIRIEAFAENRAIEIQALSEVVKDVGGNHMAFQKLPRHMRRRAMSHNLKRVPRRLHSVVRVEIEKTKAPGKKPSRKHRRRPKNLLSEYERRKRKVEWLETHIWHAKRFKMVEKWNCRLAHHPNDKSARACYRAAHNHCLMQDVSFEHYIEIKGQRQQIIDGLTHITSEKTGLTFAAKLTALGTRQGALTVYSYDSYPYQAIGPVTYLWRPQLSQDIQSSTLWICCHRSYFQSVLTEVRRCFDANALSGQPVPNETKLIEEERRVVVTSIKDELVKIRLIGPGSNRVLAETLQQYDLLKYLKNDGGRPENADELKRVVDDGTDTPSTSQWWKSYYSQDTTLESIKQQYQVWEELSKCYSPGEALPNCIIGLTVRDPRLLLPPKRSKVSLLNSGSINNSLPYEMFNASVGSSPLWDPAVRSLVKSTKVSEQKLNELKSHNQLPGSVLDLGDRESAIPVLLIQRPGVDNCVSPAHFPTSAPNGFMSGWDLILPSGWAMAFWIALVYRGARVGGLQEARNLALLARMLSIPADYPDTAAGQNELRSQSLELESKYNRRPPAKRPNYVKLGIPSPFYFQFEKLASDWKQHILNKTLDVSQYFVLRDKKVLRLLNTALTKTKAFLSKSGKRNSKDCVAVKSVDTNSLLNAINVNTFDEISMALVAVHLNVSRRGVPAMNGLVCIPTDEDLKKLKAEAHYFGPLERKHRDPGHAKRKEEKKERIRDKKRKSRELYRRKKRGEISNKPTVTLAKEGPNTNTLSNLPASILSNKTSDKLDDVTSSSINVPPPDAAISASLVNYTSRPIIGFIGQGAYNLALGQGSGTGFCSVLALLQLVENQQSCHHCTVLVRKPTSFQYRFASVSLIL